VTWLDLAPDDPFGVHNLPMCSFGLGCVSWVGVRIGDRVLNLSGAEALGLVEAHGLFSREHLLDGFLQEGPTLWRRVRASITELLTDSRHRNAVEPLLFPLDADGLRLGLPFTVRDYVDFYSSEHHATNVGRILRPDEPALPPNWRHLPVGYHGRAGTVVVSGTDVPRPCGQSRGAPGPVFGPSTRLDFEAEVGFVVGPGSDPGVPVSPDEFREHVFGVVLVNDWSARDIQAWEYRPLGPFLGKSFATSISPWVVPLDALESARVGAPVQDPPVLEYLRESERYGYDIELEVRWNGTVVSRPPFRAMYWTPAQQLAHLTVNGAWVNPGDLYASGTVSGPDRAEVGSLLELTRNGAEPVTLRDGQSRTFLADGDTVVISATAPGPDGATIGLGEVIGTVVRPAKPDASSSP
jgi:fumarylacetoacetase